MTSRYGHIVCIDALFEGIHKSQVGSFHKRPVKAALICFLCYNIEQVVELTMDLPAIPGAMLFMWLMKQVGLDIATEGIRSLSEKLPCYVSISQDHRKPEVRHANHVFAGEA